MDKLLKKMQKHGNCKAAWVKTDEYKKDPQLKD
jgi:hypothetical protein